LNEIDVLRDVAGRLDRAGLPYMLTGSLAMNYYAVPRMTRDIDLVVRLQGGDARALAEVFAPDYHLCEESIGRAIAHESLFSLIHLESVIKVDFIVMKNTEYRKREFERRRQALIGDRRIWIVSKEDLIISKLYWARQSPSDLQLRDVKNLLATGCDYAYVGRWVSELDLEALWRECLGERERP